VLRAWRARPVRPLITPGNGIVALLNGWRLTGSRAYIEKAEELIRRCVHPQQDLEALNLLDAERRWYYTVFLQALARYLEVKAERGELDDAYAYAQTTLLHYARWMTSHEYPYLEKPDVLEFPTETWAAQDTRKSDVLNLASRHAQEPERSAFRARARFFYETSVSTLAGMATRTFTRPVVLMLTNGYAQGSSELDRPLPRASAMPAAGAHQSFVSQRTRTLHLLVVAAVAVATLVLAAAVRWLGLIP
jgi:hypothetical protein